ncbi:MAG: exonuclease SbcD [Acidimicrobiales bacterium]
MSRRSLRLLHTSDVHIDGFGVGEREAEHAEVCLCPLHGLEKLAKEHDVDGVMVVGDLFDHARVSGTGVAAVYELLHRLPGECVVMVGNHDVHDERSIYHRFRQAVDVTDVLLLDDHDGSDHDMFGGALRVWGRAMDEHSPQFKPLHGVVPRPEDDAWFIAMGHGHYIDEDEPSHRSSLITPSDIAATKADYVALGHWHVTTDVSQGPVSAWYCGAPSGRPGGHALIVDLDPVNGVQITQVDVPLSSTGCA